MANTLGNSIVEEIGGQRLAPAADEVPSVLGRFGTQIVAPMEAPNPAKGQFAIPSLVIDPSAGVELANAQARVGAAVSRIGDVLTDIVNRENVFRQEQDRTEKQRNDAELQAGFYDTLYQGEIMRREGKTPQEIELFFNEKWDGLRNQAEGHEYNFISRDVVNEELNNKFKSYRYEFYNKVLEPSYMTHAKTQYVKTHEANLNMAASAGKMLDIEGLAKSVGVYSQMHADPSSALYGMTDNIYAMQGQAITSWVEAAVQENPEKAKQLLDEVGPYLEQYIPQQYVADFKEKVTRQYEIARDKALTETKKTETIHFERAKDEITAGRLTGQGIQDMVVRGEITPSKAEELHQYMFKQDNDRIERRESRDMSWVADGSKYGQKLNEKENRLLNLHHDAFNTEVLANTPDDRKVEVTINHYKAAGHFPEALVSRMSGAMNSDNPETYSAAASFLQRVRTEAPEMYNKYFADYDHLVVMHDYGYSFEHIRELRKKNYNEKDFEKSADAYFKDNDDIWEKDLKKTYGVDVSPSIGAKYDYEKLVRKNLPLVGGDFELARKMALRQLPRRAGPTTISGHTMWMEYPPDAVYGNPYKPRENKWIRENLNLDVEDVNKRLPLDQQIKLEDNSFTLVVDNRNTEQPTYSIVDIETGVVVLRGWSPDYARYLNQKEARKVDTGAGPQGRGKPTIKTPEQKQAEEEQKMLEIRQKAEQVKEENRKAREKRNQSIKRGPNAVRR